MIHENKNITKNTKFTVVVLSHFYGNSVKSQIAMKVWSFYQEQQDKAIL